ncbi:MAG: hypothetical protein NVS3B10_26760 [Polyangiales bacterium]
MPRLRALAACFVLVGGVAAAASGPGCSSESHVVGNGACDAFCNKVTGAQCRMPAERARCLDECLWYQQDCAGQPSCVKSGCSVHQNDFLRCVTLDGNVLCDAASGCPRPVGCDYLRSQRDTHCIEYASDAGSDPCARR